jgi:hypothetical protein
LAVLSKSFAPAAEAAVLVASEAAKGPSARTLLPTPAFLKNDRRLNPVFIVRSKANLPVSFAAHMEDGWHPLPFPPRPQMADELSL